MAASAGATGRRAPRWQSRGCRPRIRAAPKAASAAPPRPRRPRCRSRSSVRRRICAPVPACGGCWRGRPCAACLMPRLRAASSVRSSRAEPTPWLCQGASMLKAASASRANAGPSGRNSAAPRKHAVDEEAMHHRAQAERRADVVADELVRHAAAEPAVAAVAVETQQMVAVAVGFADPQLADHAAVGEGFLHSGSPDVDRPKTLRGVPSQQARPPTGRPGESSIIALQHKYDAAASIAGMLR